MVFKQVFQFQAVWIQIRPYVIWVQTVHIGYQQTTKPQLAGTELTLKAPITTAADDKFCDMFTKFRQK